jgi:hypothetical protein
MPPLTLVVEGSIVRAVAASNWGSFTQTTTVNPAVLEGWGVRNRDWQYGVGVQQEVAPQVSVEVSYNRRVWSSFFVTHNRALTAADYDEVTLTAPVNPRLPNGGGYPVTFLTRNTRSALGATDSYYTTSKDFGDETRNSRRTGRDGCSRRPCSCRDSCGWMYRWISDRRGSEKYSSPRRRPS